MVIRTNIEVLIEDTRIKKYLCQWSPLSQTTHIVGLYRTILVTLLADSLCNREFQEEHPLATRYSHVHFTFAERMSGTITFILLKKNGQCPVCSQREFDLLPCAEAEVISSILCRSCGAWAPNDGYYEWQSIGSGAGG